MTLLRWFRAKTAHNRFAAFIGYSLSGMVGFSIDIAFLYLLVERIGMHYSIAIILAYMVGVTIHFAGCRWLIFSTTEKSLKGAYMRFCAVAFVGVVSLSGLVAILVEIGGVHYLVSRVAAAATIGIISFFTHRRISFGISS